MVNFRTKGNYVRQSEDGDLDELYDKFTGVVQEHGVGLAGTSINNNTTRSEGWMVVYGLNEGGAACIIKESYRQEPSVTRKVTVAVHPKNCTLAHKVDEIFSENDAAAREEASGDQ